MAAYRSLLSKEPIHNQLVRLSRVLESCNLLQYMNQRVLTISQLRAQNMGIYSGRARKRYSISRAMMGNCDAARNSAAYTAIYSSRTRKRCLNRPSTKGSCDIENNCGVEKHLVRALDFHKLSLSSSSLKKDFSCNFDGFEKITEKSLVKEVINLQEEGIDGVTNARFAVKEISNLLNKKLEFVRILRCQVQYYSGKHHCFLLEATGDNIPSMAMIYHAVVHDEWELKPKELCCWCCVNVIPFSTTEPGNTNVTPGQDESTGEAEQRKLIELPKKYKTKGSRLWIMILWAALLTLKQRTFYWLIVACVVVAIAS